MKFTDLSHSEKIRVTQKRLQFLRNQLSHTVGIEARKRIELQINRGVSILNNLESSNVSDSECPVCGGTGKATTKSMFTGYGVRTSGFIGFCTFCNGSGTRQ